MGQRTLQNMIITFFVAFSLIVFEIFLSRLFSVILDYSYVFLVISLATLGIGLGGYLAYKSFLSFQSIKNTVVAMFAASMIVIVFAIYVLSYKGIVFYSSLSLIPFLLGGYFLAGVMQTEKDNIHLIYFADLLGAGLGAAGSILLMNSINPIQTVNLLSVILFMMLVLINDQQIRMPMKAMNIFLLFALMINQFYPVFDRFEFNAYRTSPHTAFYEQKDAEIVFSEWNALSRTDVYDAGDELLYITIDGSAVSPISKYSGDLSEVDYLITTTGSLAFLSPPRERVLLIGVGGGQEVLTAQLAGFQNIEAVDINQGSFDAVHALGGLTGDIYRQPGVKQIVSDGRNYIRKTVRKYDLIYLSLVMKKSENGLGLALTENFIYTEEAVKEYMDKLTEQGRLAFLLHDEFELNKVLFAAKKYFLERGVVEDEIKNYIAVTGTYQHLGHVMSGMDGMDGSKIPRPLIVINKQPFDKEISSLLYASALQIEQIPVHYPNVKDQYESLMNMLSDQKTNLSANRDDRPFFYHRTNGIPNTLIYSLIITLIAALFILRRKVVSSGQTVYFAGIAVGFMLIEITLIQKLILPLGHPTLSFVVVLGVLLVAGGIGSYFSGRRRFTLQRRYIPLLLVGILAIIVNVLIGWYNRSSVDLTDAGRLLAVILALVPLGFFMGMPFPYGMRAIQKHQVAISFALNGVMTVAGSILAAMISLTLGFTATIIIGGAIYAALYFVQPVLKFD
jgi:hypothetical protein